MRFKKTSIFLAVLLSLSLLLPFLLINPMLHRVEYPFTYNPAELGLEPESVYVETSDGLTIACSRVDTEDPKAIVIFLSGIHNPPVSAFYGHARMLKQAGYASLLVELRARGDSEGNRISLGYKEHKEVRAAVDHLKSLDEYQDVPIVVFGLSMGGATAINSIGLIDEIDGLISLSAYSSWPDVFTDVLVQSAGIPSFIGAYFRPFVALHAFLHFGPDILRIYPKRQIQNLGDRPALLVHSIDDLQVPYLNLERLRSAAPDHVETWVLEGNRHFILPEDQFMSPEENDRYREIILGFLRKHF